MMPQICGKKLCYRIEEVLPRWLALQQHMIAALQWHEASARYEARNPAPLVKWYDLVIPRVHHKCRALDTRRYIEHIGLMESLQQPQGIIGRGRLA